MKAIPSSDPNWDYDIVSRSGRVVSRFCGGWVAAQNLVDALENPKGWEPTEAYEVADAIRADAVLS